MPWDDGQIYYLRQQLDRVVAAVESRSSPASGVGSGGGGTSGGPGGIRQQISIQSQLKSAFQGSIRSVTNFAQQVGLVLPNSLGQLVRQSTEGSGAISTMQKSFQLIALQLGSIFIPVIAKVTAAFQQFAMYLEQLNRSRFWETEKGRSAKGFAYGAAGGYAGFKVGGPLGALLGFGGTMGYQGYSEMMKRFGMEERQGKEGGYLELQAAVAEAAQRARKGEVGKASQAFFQEHKGTSYTEVDMPAPVRAELAAKGLLVGMEMFKKARGGVIEEAALKGGKIGSGAAALLDNMPGYRAAYQGLEDVRRQAQLEGLNTSPLDAMMQKYTRLQAQEFAKALAAEMASYEEPMPKKGMALG